MRIEQLIYFLDVAETNSINISAERLFITQPAISESIRKLEEELGYELLLRSKKGVSLTDNGKIVQKWAEKILENVSDMKNELTNFNNYFNPSVEGLVQIGTSNLVNTILFPHILQDFEKYFPNIKVSQFHIRNYEIPSFLKSDLISVALSHVFEINNILSFPEQHDLQKEYDLDFFYEEPLYIIANKKFPISREKVVSLKDVLNYPLILMLSYGQEDDMLSILKQFGEIQIALRTDNVSLIKQAVLNGKGIGFFTKTSGNRIFFTDHANADLVHIIRIKEDIKLRYYICSKKSVQLTEPENIFLHYLKNNQLFSTL